MYNLCIVHCIIQKLYRKYTVIIQSTGKVIYTLSFLHVPLSLELPRSSFFSCLLCKLDRCIRSRPYLSSGGDQLLRQVIFTLLSITLLAKFSRMWVISDDPPLDPFFLVVFFIVWRLFMDSQKVSTAASVPQLLYLALKFVIWQVHLPGIRVAASNWLNQAIAGLEDTLLQIERMLLDWLPIFIFPKDKSPPTGPQLVRP
jgi:hypothetical protein